LAHQIARQPEDVYLDLESEADRARRAASGCGEDSPTAYLGEIEVRSLPWQQDFTRTYLERHIPQFVRRIPAETLRRLRRLPAWHANARKRLVKSPKVFVRDSGILHALLAIGDQDPLLSHPVVGASWEAS